MYKAFFKLNRNPFEITPDPSFLFPTTKHNEALASLYYGVRRHKGFVVLTGEVGTGKTMLLRCLLQLLKRGNDVAYAYIFNGLLSPVEFLQYVAGDFGLPAANKNKTELLLEIAKFVVARSQKNQTTLLVIDEAHQLSTNLLEEIRLLTNLETADSKLLQILLVGQPELDEKLDSIELRQLKQRIAFRSHLSALDLTETKGYIERRLQIAGGNTPDACVFPPSTIDAIYHYSGGLPRLINTICENAMIAAYSKQTRTITPEIIEDIAVNFRLGVVRIPRKESSVIEESDLRSAAMVLLDFYKRLQPKVAHDIDLAGSNPVGKERFRATKQ